MPLHRQVFFIGGFDPKTPRHYHRLYRDAVARRPATAAHEQVSLGTRRRESPRADGWDVQWTDPGEPPLTTRYTVMRWDDIVRRHWPRHLRQALRDYWHVYLCAGAQGMFHRVWQGSRAAFWLALFPLFVSASLLLLCAAAAAGLTVAGWVPMAWASLAVVPAWLLLWRGVETRLDSEWLLRLYGFTWFQAHGRLPDLEQRLDELADDLVQQATDSEARELLVVGHSTGGMLAVAVLARACQRAPWLGHRGPSLALLTLGHCTPILGWLRGATRFREELALLADHPALTCGTIRHPQTGRRSPGCRPG